MSSKISSSLFGVFLLITATACGKGGSSDAGGNPDGGGNTCSYGDASYPINCTYDPGFTETAPNTPNSIGVTFSGETLGIAGLPFVPNTNGDPTFVDGWSVKFTEYMVVLANIRLNNNPTIDNTWRDMGSTVIAQKQGPYVIDAHQAHGFLGKDNVEPAQGLFLWTRGDNGAFAQGTQMAFSYDIVQATYPATNVNLQPAQLADYDLMVQKHWSKMIRGVASHTTDLSQSTPTGGIYANANDPNSARAQVNFAKMPTVIYFAFGWDDHCSLINCVNTDNGDHVLDNLANRGVATNPSGTYIAQITIHVDHIFWDTLVHEGEPLRFDPIAAWAPATTTAANPFWINDLSATPNQQVLAAVFQDGTPLPDRGPYMTPAPTPAFVTDMPNSGIQVIMNPSGVTTVPATNYPDFMMFSVQSQAHLNAQGLCYTVGQHTADPYYQPQVQPYP